MNLSVPGQLLLSEAEQSCVVHLAHAWNAFIALPERHPDDLSEFRAAIHAAENIVFARPVLRALQEAPADA